ncbi:MAG: helix-turn-helix domain-containing protein [Patescibacteria group bacterium]|nr:helix-turn-helix domain-containing protein [Patescibacteria group bacterium]
MVGFSTKKISNVPSFGERLKEAREQLGITLSEAAHSTNISFKYLGAIEAGDLAKLPGEVYAKSFIRVYTRFLGLNAADYLSAYSSQQKIYSKTVMTSDKDFKKPVERISTAKLLVTPRLIRMALIILLVIACLGYLGIKIKAILTPPVLIVDQPSDNIVINNKFIEVSGQIEKETTLEINGQQVLANQAGHFDETIDLQAGANIIEFKAEKRHGQQTKIYRQVVVNEAEGNNNSTTNN